MRLKKCPSFSWMEAYGSSSERGKVPAVAPQGQGKVGFCSALNPSTCPGPLCLLPLLSLRGCSSAHRHSASLSSWSRSPASHAGDPFTPRRAQGARVLPGVKAGDGEREVHEGDVQNQHPPTTQARRLHWVPALLPGDPCRSLMAGWLGCFGVPCPTPAQRLHWELCRARHSPLPALG